MPQHQDTRSLLMPTALRAIAWSVLLQVAIVLDGHQIGAVAVAGLVVANSIEAILFIRRRRDFARVRFGALVAELVGFAAINAGFQIHAGLLLLDDHPAIAGDGSPAIDVGWWAVLCALPAGWGLLLLGNALFSIRKQGFEDRP